jgi:hypothetical protein
MTIVFYYNQYFSKERSGMSSNNVSINNAVSWEIGDEATDDLVAWLNDIAYLKPDPQLLIDLGFPPRTTKKLSAAEVLKIGLKRYPK